MYYYLIGGWVLYFVLHSVLATENAKRSVGFSPRTYRLLYSIFSTVALVGLLVLGGSITAKPFFDNEGIVRYVSLMITTFGVMTIQVSFRQYRLKSFLGLADEQEGIKIDGILKYIRHPIYAGIILVTGGFFFFIPNLPTLISA
jgi:protein-S-isoprenylcysteine O-methyltransferase Ste14